MNFNIFDYINSKEFKIRFWIYFVIIIFFVFYFCYLKLLSISLDFLIGFNLVCLFFVGYIYFSMWLNSFFVSKIKQIYMKLMKLFYLLNKVLILSLNVYESLFNLLKIGFVFFNADIISFENKLNLLKNSLLNKYFVNLFLKYFFFKLQFINKLNLIFYNNFYFFKFHYVFNCFVVLLDKLLLVKYI